MTRLWSGAGLAWGLPLATLAAGVFLRDCLVLAASGPLALCAFYLRMDADAPADPFRASIRCALAGIGSLLGAGALALATGAAILGYWQPSHGTALAGAGLLAASTGAYLAIAWDEGAAAPRRGAGMAWATLVAAVVATVSVIPVSEWSWCALPLAIAALMAMSGWRLLREVATELLCTSRESRP